MLHDAYADDPDFDWQLSAQRKAIPGTHSTVEDVSITVVGWKGRGREGRRKARGRWHHFLDPAHFAPAAPWPTDLSLYDLACDVRAFLVAHDLHPTSRAGGVAAQLLRHPDIYDTARRQVPRFINEMGRRALPGNHYQFVDGQPRSHYPHLWYMDQEAAHHRAAASIELPHADGLVAHGFHWGDDSHDPLDRVWLAGDRLARWLRHRPCGLLYGRLRLMRRDLPRLRYDGTDPAPKWFNRLLPDGTAMVFLFTNELPLLERYGVTVEYLTAAWASLHDDEALHFYAEWALHESRAATGLRRYWLKSTLHAVYGMLAARTVTVEFVRRQGRADDRIVFLGDGRIMGKSNGPRTFTPRIANTIQRGMIEAETRNRSCSLALSLRTREHRVVSIYADGVLVESAHDDGRAPAVGLARRDGGVWLPKHEMTSVEVHDETHFTSAQLVKWPGTNNPVRRVAA